MRDCFAPNFSSFGRVKVEDSEHIWHFVKAFGRSFSLTLLEVGAEDACAMASHQTFRRSEESKLKTVSTCGTL